MYKLGTREGIKDKDISERWTTVFERKNDGCKFDDTE